MFFVVTPEAALELNDPSIRKQFANVWVMMFATRAAHNIDERGRRGLRLEDLPTDPHSFSSLIRRRCIVRNLCLHPQLRRRNVRVTGPTSASPPSSKSTASDSLAAPHHPPLRGPDYSHWPPQILLFTLLHRSLDSGLVLFLLRTSVEFLLRLLSCCPLATTNTFRNQSRPQAQSFCSIISIISRSQLDVNIHCHVRLATLALNSTQKSITKKIIKKCLTDHLRFGLFSTL